MLGLMAAQAAEDWVSPQWPLVIRGDPRAMAIDADGHRFVLGGFRDSGDFDPLPGSTDILAGHGNSSDVCITRIEADGGYTWTQGIGGSLDEGFALVNIEWNVAGIAVHGGIVYGWISFLSPDLMMGANGPFAPLGGGATGLVFALDAATGNPISTFGTDGAVRIGSSLGIFPRAIAVHDGVIYAAGEFSGDDFGIGSLSAMAMDADSGCFVAAIDAATGAAVNTFGIDGVQVLVGSDGGASPWAITATSEGVYVVGTFVGTQLGIGGLGVLDALGSSSIVVAALDRVDGSPVVGFGVQGLQRIGNDDYVSHPGLTVTATTVYVVGLFSGEDLGIGGPGDMDAEEVDGFVAALDRASGIAQPGFGIGGLVRIGGNGYDRCLGVVETDGFLAVTGAFLGTSDLGIGGASDGRTLGGSFHGFVAALDAETGAAHTSLGSDGVITIQGHMLTSVYPRAVAGYNGTVSVLLHTSGSHVFIEGGGRFELGSDDFTRGVLTQWDLTTGLPLRSQTLTMDPIRPRIVGAPSFMPVVIGDPTSGNPISLVSSDPTIASVSGMVVTIQGLGSCDIIAVQAAGNGRAAVTVSQPLQVIPDGVSPTPGVQVRYLGDMAVDTGGNRYLLRKFIGTMDEHPSVGVGDGIQSATGWPNLVVTRVNADGSHGWTQTITGGFELHVGAIAIGQGTVYVLGSTGAHDIAIGASRETSLWTMGGIDVFIAALDATTGVAVESFGRFGIQRIGGDSEPDAWEWGTDLTVAGNGVYVVGRHASDQLGIGSAGTFAASGTEYEIFIAGLHGGTGAALPGFGTGGLQRITGPYTLPTGITTANQVLYVTGSFSGTGLGIAAPGDRDSTGSGSGFVAAVRADTGQAVTAFGTGGILPIHATGGANLQRATVSGQTLYLLGSAVGTLMIGDLGPALDLDAGPGFVASVLMADGQARTGFGDGGLVGFGSSESTLPKDLVALGGKVILTGTFRGDDFGVGTSGSVTSPVGQDAAMIVVLDGRTGAPDPGFSDDGIEVIGPGGSLAVARSQRRAVVAGYLVGSAAGIGGTGTWDATTGWGGWMLAVDPQGVTTGSGTAWPGTGSVSSGGGSGCGNGITTFAVLLFLVFGLRRSRPLPRHRGDAT